MPLQCDFDDGAAYRAALGLIILRTDETLEDEGQSLLHGPGVVCRYARIPSHALVTPEKLAAMEQDMPVAADLLPQNANIRAIGYACTSASTVIGPERVEEIVQKSHPGVPVTNPITAVMTALRALGIKRIGLLTPYTPDVTLHMRDMLTAEGFEIARMEAFGQIEDRKIARITEASTLEAIKQVGDDDAVQAVFASCTSLRTFGILQAAEAAIGKPVVSSNQALCWHMRKLAGLSAGNGPGRLFRL